MSDSITYIKNSVVKMKWNSQWFLESRDMGCFVAAVEVYNGKPVVFQNNMAYTIMDGDTNDLASIDDILYVVSDSFMHGESVEDSVDGFIPLISGGMLEQEAVNAWGFTKEDTDDMFKRIVDLMGYYATVESDSMD